MAIVMAGWSDHLTTLFLGKLEQAVNQYFVYILSLVTDNNPYWMIQRKGGEGLNRFNGTNLTIKSDVDQDT